MEEEKMEHMQKMKKMEMEMEEVFRMKVQEKKQKLQDSEADVSKLKMKNDGLGFLKGNFSRQNFKHLVLKVN